MKQLQAAFLKLTGRSKKQNSYEHGMPKRQSYHCIASSLLIDVVLFAHHLGIALLSARANI